MRVLALGGAGDMGRFAIAVLLDSPIVSSITIADKNYELANIIVELTGSKMLSATEINVIEHDKLVKLISTHDIVMNTVGPYYKFTTMVLDACIKARKPYIDICDDWKPTIDLLNEDPKAKSSGITALIGMGASPGITNLLAVLACSRLDELDEVITAWGFTEDKVGKKPKYYVKPKKVKKALSFTSEKGSAAAEHLFWEAYGKIPTFYNRKRIEIDSLTKAEPIQFPGYQSVDACHIGHPEPITLPRTIKANKISNLMFGGKTYMNLVYKYHQKILDKELTISEAGSKFEQELNDIIRKVRTLRGPVKEFISPPMLPPLCAIVTGTKNGKRKKVAIGITHVPYGDMAGITGAPLAIGTLLMLEGKITQKGVLTPEETINPGEFLDRMAPYCGKNVTGQDIIIIREEEL